MFRFCYFIHLSLFQGINDISQLLFKKVIWQIMLNFILYWNVFKIAIYSTWFLVIFWVCKSTAIQKLSLPITNHQTNCSMPIIGLSINNDKVCKWTCNFFKYKLNFNNSDKFKCQRLCLSTMFKKNLKKIINLNNFSSKENIFLY